MTGASMLNIAEVEFQQACERLGLSPAEVGLLDMADTSFFTDADGTSVKTYDDVLLTRSVPVSSGARWTDGDAKPGCLATVILFTEDPHSVAYLECYCEPDGFAFGWEETSHLKLHRTTEEKWPK